MTNKARLLFLVLFTVGEFAVLSTVGYTQTNDALRNRLRQADAGSSLEDPKLKPWHMVLEVQLFSKGQPMDKGTIEEWWGGPTRRKTAFLFPSYTSIEVQDGDTFYRTKGSALPPREFAQIARQASRPGFYGTSDLDKAQLQSQMKTFGPLSLDCIMVAPLSKDLKRTAFGSFQTHCIEDATSSLRVMYSFEDLMVIRNRLGKFEGKQVAVDMDVSTVTNTKYATVHTAVLTIDSDGQNYTPGEEMEKVERPPIDIDSVVMNDYLIKSPFISTNTAKALHATSPVLLSVVIGRDGKVRSATAISNSNQPLAGAAIDAAKQWAYKPFLVDGEPVEVRTSVVMGFR